MRTCIGDVKYEKKTYTLEAEMFHKCGLGKFSFDYTCAMGYDLVQLFARPPNLVACMNQKDQEFIECSRSAAPHHNSSHFVTAPVHLHLVAYLHLPSNLIALTYHVYVCLHTHRLRNPHCPLPSSSPLLDKADLTHSYSTYYRLPTTRSSYPIYS